MAIIHLNGGGLSRHGEKLSDSGCIWKKEPAGLDETGVREEKRQQKAKDFGLNKQQRELPFTELGKMARAANGCEVLAGIKVNRSSRQVDTRLELKAEA